jgi:hypothetical protein
MIISQVVSNHAELEGYQMFCLAWFLNVEFSLCKAYGGGGGLESEFNAKYEPQVTLMEGSLLNSGQPRLILETLSCQYISFTNNTYFE